MRVLYAAPSKCSRERLLSYLSAGDLLRSAKGLKGRVAAFALAVAYYLLAFLCVIGASSVLRGATGLTLAEQLRGGAVSALVGHGVLLLALAIVPTLAMILITRSKFEMSGWTFSAWLPRLGLGVLLGSGTMTLIVLALVLAGVLRIDNVAPMSAASAAMLLLPWILIWLVQSMHEETLARGYGFIQIARSLGFWPAALLSSTAFAACHLGNSGETTLGLINAGLLGFALAYTLRRTGSLWLALGFHASWNFTQSTVLGLSNSGSIAQDALLRFTLAGPEFLTGGSAGPEGGALASVAAIVLMVFAHLQAVQPKPAGE